MNCIRVSVTQAKGSAWRTIYKLHVCKYPSSRVISVRTYIESDVFI